MKVSIVIPVYFNEDNLRPLYKDLQEKFIQLIDYDYEIVMVNDGSADRSYEIMKEIADSDKHVKIISLSRNFGSHAAILCGISNCTGDCAIIKAADLTLECSVADIYKTPNFESFICTIDNTYVEESCLNDKGKPDYTKIRPVLFEFPNYQYLRTGDVIGKCLSFKEAR